MKLNTKGFTLIELLAVVAIVALLVVIAIPNVIKYYDEAETRSFITQGQYLYKAAEQQFVQDRIKNGAYPNGRVYDNVNNPLKLQGGGKDLIYSIKVNSDGAVSYMDYNDGTWSIKIPSNGDTSSTSPITMEDLSKDNIVAVGEEGGGIEGGGTEGGEIVSPDPDATVYNPNTPGIPNTTYFDWLDEEDNWIAGCFSGGSEDETNGTLASSRLNCRIIADNRRCSDGKKVCPDSTNEDAYLNTSVGGVYFASTSSDTNGKGLYYTVDNTSGEKTPYTTWLKSSDLNGDGENERVYYYRGAVANNYVQFAGALWQIIRIDERGNIRMMKETSTVECVWNTEGTAHSFNEYVSYMFNSSNAYSSTLKRTLDEIYQKNFYGSSNQVWENFISDSGYCNDRSSRTSYIATIDSISATYYCTNIRANDAKPTYRCGSDDTFTTQTSLFGNKAVGFLYPIGTITVDELEFAGSSWGKSASGDFLSKLADYHTMSPAHKYNQARIWARSSTGIIGMERNSETAYVYPVISLKPTSKVTVASQTNPGTKDNPYVVGPTGKTWVD